VRRERARRERTYVLELKERRKRKGQFNETPMYTFEWVLLTNPVL